VGVTIDTESISEDPHLHRKRTDNPLNSPYAQQ
jgi:hypothetical protein